VKWDDEGVEPVETTLVKDGVLTDFQTTRETATELAPYYTKRGMPVRSNGCGGCRVAHEPLSQIPPNFALKPGTQSTSYDDLLKGIKKGIALTFPGISSRDFQGLNGTIDGTMREINNGVLGDFIINGGIQFRTPDLWKNVVALGGPESVRHIGNVLPHTTSPLWRNTISAVPVLLKDVPIIDYTRR